MRVVVERVRNRIYLRSPWTPEMPDRCKSISGAGWSKTAKAWTYPLDLEVCRMLREEFGDDLDIGPDLWDWSTSEAARETKVRTALTTSKEDAYETLQVPTRVAAEAPFLAEGLRGRPYQIPGVMYIAAARQALLGDQPGLGKTIQTLGGLVEGLPAGGRVLVLAPRTAVNTVWRAEIRKWLKGFTRGGSITSIVGLSGQKLDEAMSEYNDVSEPRGDDDARLCFLLANAEMARIQNRKECPGEACNGNNEFCQYAEDHTGSLEPRIPALFEIEWDAIVVDETHKWLINANSRTKSVSQVGMGMAKLRSVENGMRIALSGTPLKGKKHNLFGTLHWLRPKVYTSKWAWIGRYFSVIEGAYAREIGDLLPSKRKSFDRALDSIMLRRTKEEIRALNPAWMPPEKEYHDVWVDMTPAQTRAYNQIALMGEADIEGGHLDTLGILSQFTRMKQLASCSGRMDGDDFVPELPSAKFDWLVEFLEARGIEERAPQARKSTKGDLSEDVRKVVVASQFTKNINLWAAELVAKGIQCYVLTGETKDRDRERIVRDFQEKDDVRVFFINTYAGGVAITLDAADDMVIMDETWVPDEQEQVEDRVHRASNVKHQVDVWYVRTNGTVEEDIAKTNLTKAESNHVVLDMQRGLAFAAQRFGVKA